MARCSSRTTPPARSTGSRALQRVRLVASAGRLAATGIAAAIVAVGCSRGDRPGLARDSSTPLAAARTGSVVRVALVPDSATAEAFADSLSREGWDAESGK